MLCKAAGRILELLLISSKLYEMTPEGKKVDGYFYSQSVIRQC